MGVQVPLDAWTPDTPDYGGGNSTEALNVIPKSRSYGPFPSFAILSDALTARCQGAVFVRKADGTGVVFAGDATKLYQLSGTTFSDVSRTSGGAYATATDGFWSFVQFGSNVLAFNGIDAPQTFNVDSDSNFSALAGSPPTALYCCVAGDFVMAAQTSSARSTVYWSAINNSADWVTSQSTQASNQALPDGGWVQGLVGIPYAAVIFQEFAIKLASYEGPPTIFRFSKIADGLGCTIPGSIANYRDLIFFCDRSGFYMLQGGAVITPIGEQAVNLWFWANVNQNYLARCCSGVDPVNGLYVIAFPDQTSTAGEINHLLAYSWTIGRWTHIQPGNLEFLFSAATQTGFTLEGLDSVFTSGIDGAPGTSLDSYIWTGIARRILGAFNTDHKLGYFNGDNLAPTVTTVEANLITGKKAFVRGCRPLADGGTWSVTLGTRNRLNDSVSYGSAVAQDSYGRCLFRSKARYHRAKLTCPSASSWTHVQGLDDIEAHPMGMR